MKLYKKIASLLAVAALAAVLMPVCMAAPGYSIETRLNHAFALRASTEFYEEVVTTSPDGTPQTMTAARSNGNAYIKMDMGEAGQLVYILKDGQGYLVDAASKLAVKGEVPTVTVSEEVVSVQGMDRTVRPCPIPSPGTTARRPPSPTASSAMTSSMWSQTLPKDAPSWSTASPPPAWTRTSSTSLRTIRS